MRYRLLIFDFDGTLADSLGPAVALFNRLAPDLGLRAIADAELIRATPTRELLRRAGVRFWRLPRIARAFREAAAEGAHLLQLHAGIADSLRLLHADGARLGILSSNREDNIRACLRANAIEEYFSFVVGYPKLFGKAKALRSILRSEKYPRDSVIFVGDEGRDIEAGRRIGIDTAAVTWGFQEERLLSLANPRWIFRSPLELRNLNPQ